MRQLLPAAIDPVDPFAVYGDVPVAVGRPGVRLNMIASVDGAAAVDGRSGGLGGPADHRLFSVLRALADVVLVAAGTVRAEGYGPASLPDGLQAARRERDETPVPAIAVVSRSCQLDWDSSFFTAATVRPVVLTVADAPAARLARAVEVADVVVAGEVDVDLRRALAALAERGARSVLAEGGPSLNGQLASVGLLDEVCLTLAPWLAGGDARRILTNASDARPRTLRLSSVCEEDEYLFLRFR